MIFGAFFLDVTGKDTDTDAEGLTEFIIRDGTTVPYGSPGWSRPVVVAECVTLYNFLQDKLQDRPVGKGVGVGSTAKVTESGSWPLITGDSLVIWPKGQHSSYPTGIQRKAVSRAPPAMVLGHI